MLENYLVQLWVNLVANWNTWEEEEVEPTSNITPELQNPPEFFFLEIQLLPMSSPENI
jgi:hypothetical protein